MKTFDFYNPKIIMWLAVVLIVPAVALLVIFTRDSASLSQLSLKHPASNESVSLLSTVEQIPDFIFPNLEKQDIRIYEFWREICHLMGSFLLVVISYVLYRVGWRSAPVIFLVVILIWITYQEAWLHPLKYNQQVWNGLLDWFVWMTPMIAYNILLRIKFK